MEDQMVYGNRKFSLYLKGHYHSLNQQEISKICSKMKALGV